MANNDPITERNLALERMELVIADSGMSIPEFSKHIGLPRNGEFILPIQRQECGISLALAERICRRFPQYNMVWLATGFGSIYNESSRYRTIPYYDCDLDDILDSEKFVPKEQLQMFFLDDYDFAIRYPYYDMGDIIHAGNILFVKEIRPETVLHNSLNIVVFGTHAVARKVHRGTGPWVTLMTDREEDRQIVNVMEIRRVFNIKAMMTFIR
ncbi:MAG: hypothetical protein IKC42_04375 [Alistipes sp.]|nr:hypothetical protein [Alistipes sp.]